MALRLANDPLAVPWRTCVLPSGHLQRQDQFTAIRMDHHHADRNRAEAADVEGFSDIEAASDLSRATVVGNSE